MAQGRPAVLRLGTEKAKRNTQFFTLSMRCQSRHLPRTSTYPTWSSTCLTKNTRLVQRGISLRSPAGSVAKFGDAPKTENFVLCPTHLDVKFPKFSLVWPKFWIIRHSRGPNLGLRRIKFFKKKHCDSTIKPHLKIATPTQAGLDDYLLGTA